MSYESENQNVSHPNHYQGGDGLEVIEVIRSFTGLHYEGYLQGNAIKYILRYDKKGGVEDIEKAIWYLTELKEYLEVKDKVETVIQDGSLVDAISNLGESLRKAVYGAGPVTEGYLNKV